MESACFADSRSGEWKRNVRRQKIQCLRGLSLHCSYLSILDMPMLMSQAKFECGKPEVVYNGCYVDAVDVVGFRCPGLPSNLRKDLVCDHIRMLQEDLEGQAYNLVSLLALFLWPMVSEMRKFCARLYMSNKPLHAMLSNMSFRVMT